MHTGFLNEEEAGAIKDTGLDAVLVNLIKSKKAIEEVYNLKGKTYEDYLETLRVIKRFRPESLSPYNNRTGKRPYLG